MNKNISIWLQKSHFGRLLILLHKLGNLSYTARMDAWNKLRGLITFNYNRMTLFTVMLVIVYAFFWYTVYYLAKS